MLWANRSSQETFSEPVKYLPQSALCRGNVEAGADGGCGIVRWRCKDSRALQQEGSAGDGVKENRKFHGWRHGVGRAGVIDRAVITRRRGAGGHQLG